MTGHITETGEPSLRGVASGIRDTAGFTLIELLMVITIIGLLATIAVPTYQNSVVRAREAVLMEDLYLMRDALDKYYADNGKYPGTLADLAEKRYIRKVPVDPFTGSDATWITVDAGDVEGVYDIKSGSELTGINGIAYSEW